MLIQSGGSEFSVCDRLGNLCKNSGRC